MPRAEQRERFVATDLGDVVHEVRLHLAQEPFILEPVAMTNGNVVQVSLSTPAGAHRQQPLQNDL